MLQENVYTRTDSRSQSLLYSRPTCEPCQIHDADVQNQVIISFIFVTEKKAKRVQHQKLILAA